MNAILVTTSSRNPPSDDFRLVLVLPLKPNNGGDNTRGVLGELVEADADGGRLLACTLFARAGQCLPTRKCTSTRKIGIVDDVWLTIGSANLNEHSLFNDTEMNIVTHDAGVARETRLSLAEHLELTRDEVAGDSTRVVDELWKPISKSSS